MVLSNTAWATNDFVEKWFLAKRVTLDGEME